MPKGKSEESATPVPVFRGHHLVCLHFYDGTGYSSHFMERLAQILIKAEEGNITICSGADCVCAECPHMISGKCSYNENADADIRLMDDMALKLLGLSAGESIEWKELRSRVERIFPVWYEMSCLECDWRPACEKNLAFRRLSGSR
jgi:uncharacterized protein